MCRLAEELDADADELLLLTNRVPHQISELIKRNHKLFKQLSLLSDSEIHELLSKLAKQLNLAAAFR